MSRIRSVHPGLFTDEAFVSLSSDAQMFLIGIWTEADDQGIFEWKPLTLKMRLRPAKDGSVEPLLKEMLDNNIVCSFDINGKRYGAIRNFRKYQKPKTPNSVHPITEEIRNYVGLKNVISEIELVNDDQFPQKVEKTLLMEEGGGKVEEINGRDSPTSPKDFKINNLNGVVKGVKKSPPKHGQKDKKGNVYLWQGTTEFEAYAQDYHAVTGKDLNINARGGRWFKIAGENPVYRALDSPKSSIQKENDFQEENGLNA